MDFSAVNYLAVIVAAVAAFAVGALWYAVLFSKPWMAAVGMTEAQIKQGGSPVPFIIAIVAYLVMAFVLSAIGAAASDLWGGLILGVVVWIGFIATTTAVNYAFANRKPELTLIDAGGWLAVAAVMGAIIGAF
jgi:hypothetical protein